LLQSYFEVILWHGSDFIDLIIMEIEIRSKSTLMVINLYGVKNVDAAELITVWNRSQPLSQ
jgi:hypothetical protein